MFQRLRRLHSMALYPSNVHWYSSNKITNAFRMLRGPNFHWRDCKSPLAVPFLSQMSAVHMFLPCLFYVNFNARWVQVFPTVTVKLLVFRRVRFWRNYFHHTLGSLPLKEDAVVFPNLQPIPTRLQGIVSQNTAVVFQSFTVHFSIQ
jgi:hypothetical protein